jgi:hypothetical protein
MHDIEIVDLLDVYDSLNKAIGASQVSPLGHFLS